MIYFCNGRQRLNSISEQVFHIFGYCQKWKKLVFENAISARKIEIKIKMRKYHSQRETLCCCYCIGWFLKRFHLVFFNHLGFQRRKKQSLSKFSSYSAIVKISKIRHLKGRISPKNHDSKIIFMQEWTLHCCCTCVNLLSFC